MQPKKVLMFSYEMVMPNIIGNILAEELKSEYKILLTIENSQQEAEDYEPNLILLTSCRRASLIPILKACKSTKDIPIILMSHSFSREEGEALGPEAFLHKPLDIRVFLDIVNDLLHK